MLSQRERAALDDHITGHGGEDQFPDVRVVKVTINRAEGPRALCGLSYDFDSFEKASEWLRSRSHTYPQNGGYDKHDFWVLFADGEEYAGRLDCKGARCPDNDLDVKQHMVEHLTYVSGHPELFGSAAAEAREYLETYIEGAE